MSKALAKPSDATVESVEPLTSEEARWTKLVKYPPLRYHCLGPLSKTTSADTSKDKLPRSDRAAANMGICRTPPNSAIDGVGIVAILRKATGPEILLQKQFRPPTNKVCIEVPAGLIDEGETPEECAVRELREETGFVGVAEKAEKMGGMGVMFNDPGFTNTNLCMIHVSVDTSLPENQLENLKPELEENEFIEVFSVPLKSLWTECQKLEGEGYAIDARVGTLAEGIEVARRWELFGRI
ncbi:hypothetical protein MMC13_002606 [Lambiella insularis]|nr:hypothetical protein [Lambiella insularis]